MKYLIKFKTSIKNLIFFFKIIKNHRAYDYSFTFDLILKDLQYKEKVFNDLLKEKTEYDNIIKENLNLTRLLILYLEDYLKADMNGDIEETDKKFNIFMNMYKDNIRKLWYWVNSIVVLTNNK